MKGIKIISTGSFLPPTAVDNHKLSETVDTSHEWIHTRTGISSRYYAKDISNCEMAINAAKDAIKNGKIPKEKIKIVVVATFTPDNFTPSTACIVQRELGLAEDVLAFDINTACTGFVYALKVAQGLLQDTDGYGLVIGSEKISSHLDFEDRATCVLFGDGAGAAVVTSDNEYLNHWHYGSRGDSEAIKCKAKPSEEEENTYINMDGKAVFKFATEVLKNTVETLCEKSAKKLSEYDYVVCHQANERIISHTSKKLKAKEDQFYVNIADYGNTSAASIPIALAEMNQKGLINKGNKIMLVGFGAGLSWGGVTLKW